MSKLPAHTLTADTIAAYLWLHSLALVEHRDEVFLRDWIDGVVFPDPMTWRPRIRA